MTPFPEHFKSPGERLLSFLQQRGIAQATFAHSIGIGQASLSKLCSGKSRPKLATAAAIERKTDGEIPASAWVPADEPVA